MNESPVKISSAVLDTMRQYNAGETVRKRTVYRHSLSGTGIYQFCPYCLKRLGVKLSDLAVYFSLAQRKGKRSEDDKSFMANIADKALTPLDVVRNKVLLAYPSDKGRWAVVTFETIWECPMCKRELTEDDFMKFWTKPRNPKADEKKFINLDNPKDLENF